MLVDGEGSLEEVEEGGGDVVAGGIDVQLDDILQESQLVVRHLSQQLHFGPVIMVGQFVGESFDYQRLLLLVESGHLDEGGDNQQTAWSQVRFPE